MTQTFFKVTSNTSKKIKLFLYEILFGQTAKQPLSNFEP